jgi:sugar phosphate isomerase/epimerase
MDISVMLYSFSNALRAGDMSAEDAIRFCADMDVHAIEPMDGLLWAGGHERADLRRMRGLLDELSFSVPCYDISADLVQAEAGKRADAIDRAKQQLDRAAAVEAANVLIVPGMWKEDLDPAQSREWAVAGLRACAEYAAGLGIHLTIEDHSPQCVSGATVQDLIDLCSAVDNLAVTYDVGNFLFGGDDPIAAIETLGARIRHVHFKDWVPVSSTDESRRATPDGQGYTGAALGTGILQHEPALKELKAIGYEGAVSVEYEGPDDPRPEIKAGVEYVRSLMETLGI